MQTLTSQLFVITFTLALLSIIIFIYKITLRSLGGPDPKEKKARKVKKAASVPAAEADAAQEAAPARRPVVRREETMEGGERHE